MNKKLIINRESSILFSHKGENNKNKSVFQTKNAEKKVFLKNKLSGIFRSSEYRLTGILSGLFIGIFLAITSCSTKIKQAVDYVDPFICTQGDHGHWHPSALIPFGLVKLGPDTYPGSLTADGDFAHSGYDYSDDQIRGFSHFHKGSSGGTSIIDRAGLLSLVPFVEMPTETFWENPVFNIDKQSEKAEPGYYSVVMDEEKIKVELSATMHAGFHRYTYPEEKTPRLFIYEGNRSRSAGISLHFVDPQTIEGKQSAYAGIYFVIKFSSPVTSSKVWDGGKLVEGNKLENQHNGGIVCEFGELAGKKLGVKVGVSLTGIEAARNNLQSECTDCTFDVLKVKASEKWNNKLSLIEVSGDEEHKTIFYTALYHTCFLPVTTTDSDGTYPGLDQQVHNAIGYTHYDDYAFWDSFRTKYPLYSLFLPGIYMDIVKSLRDIYEKADNWLPYPDGLKHTPHNEANFVAWGKNGYQAYGVCRHEHMLMVMTDAYYKGLFDVDMKEIYPYLRQEALLQMPERYDVIGYIPNRADQTGEYSWDNWCVAQIAKSIGKEDDYDYFMKRSEYWKNTWDTSLNFFRARSADGSWLDFPEDPTINREKYTYEGTLWQWRWNVIHDVPSLIGAFGGKENFVKELNYFFENSLYTAGNQPDLQAPFLFNFAGESWLTQKWVRNILTEPMIQRYGTHDFLPESFFDRIYKATPDGYLEEMDDDYGCMSAWYVLSSMGLYQICPGNPVYQITAPIFSEVRIRLDSTIYSGKEFTIKAHNLNSENIYIQSATLNGEPLNRSWISHHEVIKGGELVYEMGPKPNKGWGQSN